MMKKFFDKYKNNILLLVLLNSTIILMFLLPRLIIPNSMLDNAQQWLGRFVGSSLRIHLLLIFVLLIFVIKSMWKQFSRVKLISWILLGVIVLLGVYQFWFVAPHTHRVYFDEDIYTSIAANIATQGIALKTNYGTPQKCIEGEYNKDPSGMPAVVSLAFSMFGVDEYLASRVTVTISILTIILIFILSYLLFANELLSLLASLMFVLLPETIIWAPTVAAEPYFVFFAALAFVGLFQYLKTFKARDLFFALLVVAYAAQTRPEGILLLIPFQIALFFAKDFTDNLKDKKFILSWIGFLILIIPQFLTFAVFRQENWGAGDSSMFGLSIFLYNLKTNFLYFFENLRVPVLFSSLAVLGFFPFRKWFKEKITLLAFGAVFFVIFLFFYAGSYNYGTDVRFSLILNIPLVILAACGVILINSLLVKRIKLWLLVIIWIILFILSYRAVYPAIPIGKESENSRVSHDYMVEILRELPEDSYLLSYDPCIVINNRRSAAQTFYGANKEVMDDIFSKTDHVYFYRDIWSQIPPHDKQWKKFFKKYKLKRVKSRTFQQYEFILYRVIRF
jgi:Dolichyl-phosphate-mannose-protein mannosyltransferase